jgi:hypothetical protein
MKIKFALLFTFLFLLVVLARAQTAHQAVLTWTASSDAAANPTLGYNVYRLSASCPKQGTSGFTKLNSAPVMALTYTDTPLPVGNVCYCVLATLNGVESKPSNKAGGTVGPGTVVLMLQIQ